MNPMIKKIAIYLLTLAGILMVFIMPMTYAYFSVQTNNNSSSFLIQSSIEEIRPDITININGTVNKSANYTRSISCSTGATPYWNRKWDSLVFSNVADEEEECGLTYAQDTSNHSSALLSTVVQNNAADNTNLFLLDYSNSVDKTSLLGNVQQFDSSSNIDTPSTSGIGSISVWSLNANNEYQANPSAMTYSGNRYYHIYATVSENGYYRVCYTISTGTSSTSNGIHIGVNSTRKRVEYASQSQSVSNCADIGGLSIYDNINISVYRKSGTTMPTFSFKIYKYSGTTNKTSNLNPTQFHNSTSTATSGTSLSIWSLNANNEYQSDPSAMTYNGSRFYHIYAQVPELGYYQVCYTINSGTGSTNNKLMITLNDVSKTSINSSQSDTVTGCFYLGLLDTTDYVNISQYRYSSYTSPVMTWKLEEASQTTSINAGYHYYGSNPNNYIWFNNEMWRIIGLVPTCTSSNCGTSANLVKIIRKYPLSSLLAYDAKSSGNSSTWGDNTLYSLLNDYYYGKQNAISTDYCKILTNNTHKNCDFSEIGINPQDYYGSMVENAYWNTGPANLDNIVSYSVQLEREKQTVSGHVGLASASDCELTKANYKRVINGTLPNEEYANFWMVAGYTLNPQSYIGHNSVTTCSESVSSINSNNDGSIFPVVYLSPNVYVVSGTGTEANPYIIAK